MTPSWCLCCSFLSGPAAAYASLLIIPQVFLSFPEKSASTWSALRRTDAMLPTAPSPSWWCSLRSETPAGWRCSDRAWSKGGRSRWRSLLWTREMLVRNELRLLPFAVFFSCGLRRLLKLAVSVSYYNSKKNQKKTTSVSSYVKKNTDLWCRLSE